MAGRRITVWARIPNIGLSGPGFIAGEAPADPEDPESPDGRTKILGVPARVRITAHERSTMRCIGEAVSASDGTWRIDNINPTLWITVLFWNDPPQKIEVEGQMRPINGVMQDWIRAEPYEP